MKNHIINNTQTTLRKNTRILDLIGTLNTDGMHSQTSQLNSLKHFTARDNVHLTSDGYIKLAAGAAREAAVMIKADDMKVKIPGNGRPIPYWRGFVIH
jgi:formylmethanofuran dehydrogenase subunit C